MSSLDLIEERSTEQFQQPQQNFSTRSKKRPVILDLISSSNGFLAACTSTTGNDATQLCIWRQNSISGKEEARTTNNHILHSIHTAWQIIETPHSKLLALELAVVADIIIIVAITNDELLCRWEIEGAFSDLCVPTTLVFLYLLLLY
jgi:hypothetical protein